MSEEVEVCAGCFREIAECGELNSDGFCVECANPTVEELADAVRTTNPPEARRIAQDNAIEEEHGRIEAEARAIEAQVERLAPVYEEAGCAKDVARQAARICIEQGPEAANAFVLARCDDRSERG